MHQQNAHIQYNTCIIVFPPTCFGTYCAIFRENFFVYAQSYCYICDLFMLKTFVTFAIIYKKMHGMESFKILFFKVANFYKKRSFCPI